ncbi:hypothetical protein PBY51_005705 [Eleginops maclovinus]|uniref:Uncharacterized protein n=1 Tax=Eleginops maclovinus TaxID=56733 RepID=A0AAN8AAQ4_ELEMC|nr:hypothetical protein PBY51_005705 [Eleginops maclovinus]
MLVWSRGRVGNVIAFSFIPLWRTLQEYCFLFPVGQAEGLVLNSPRGPADTMISSNDTFYTDRNSKAPPALSRRYKNTTKSSSSPARIKPPGSTTAP